MQTSSRLSSMILLIAALVLSVNAVAKNCGYYMGHKIVTEGGLSCAEAKKVYKAFQKGHIPAGWTCGQSVGGCGKGDKSFSFKLN